MNLDKLFAFAIAVVIGWAEVGQLDFLQNWIWKAQAKLIYESRTETWGSPRFFPTPKEADEKSAAKPGKNLPQ